MLFLEGDLSEANRGEKIRLCPHLLFHKCVRQNSLFVPAIDFEVSELICNHHNTIMPMKM